MSLRKDYIQRQFEEFGKVLAQLLSYKHQSDWDKFEKEISEAMQKFTALDISAIEKLSADDFETEILLSDTLQFDQKKIVGTLLFEKMLYYIELADYEKQQALRTKCLALYNYLQQNFTENQFDLDVYYKLSFLNKA
jgi:hypothetical protein